MSDLFDATRDHRITQEEAAGLVKAFQAGAKAGDHRATVFNRSAFEQLLAQPEAAGIRIYRAMHADGPPTLVMVAVDTEGQDVATSGSVFIQKGTDCPPNCGAATWY